LLNGNWYIGQIVLNQLTACPKSLIFLSQPPINELSITSLERPVPSTMAKGDFRDLDVWQACKEIRKDVWFLCKTFPGEEKYRLSDQMIRASRSSTACIAEGYGRFHYQETIQFCRQARGSLYELIDHLHTGAECGYIGAEKAEELIHRIKNAIRMLNGYVKYLKQRKEEKEVE
jgi:four helix bundle protein